ncbi:MAG: radical SAM protein [Gemmatimonadetes bacterium]|nr:radical SAM protein [Gemmatimonadota bacterium]
MRKKSSSAKPTNRIMDPGSFLSDHSRSFDAFRYVYPVVSRRSAGLSVGVNVNPNKVCSFSCRYCQVDRGSPAALARVDLDLLFDEVDALLDLAQSGRIFSHPRFEHTPEEWKRLNDVAFSGDGEPTSYPLLGEAISGVQNILDERGAGHVKTIVLTNGTRLGDAEVRARLEVLAARPYEIWVKLDAGTQTYFETISGKKLALDRIVDGIATLARTLEVTIQCLVPTLHGSDPGDDEIVAIADRVRFIANQGGRVKLVQLHTTARRPAHPEIGRVSDDRLECIGQLLRTRLDMPVAIYPGRDWE